jgi:Holliday junction resolvase
MLEKTIERQLVKAVKKMGGRAVKFVSPGCDGMPDRLVLLPKGRVVFVEVKAPGKKPRALQIARHEMLRDLGFSVYVLDSIEMIGDMLNDIYTA